MKPHLFVCFFFALIIHVISKPQSPDANAVLSNYDFSNNDDGGYEYSWTSSNGITREEIGELVNAGTDDEYFVVRGFYSYPASDGTIISVAYTSYPEHGFEAQGEHLSGSAGTKKEPALGIPSAALASLAGASGLG